MLIGRDPGAIEDIWKFLCKGAYWRGGPIQNSALAARREMSENTCQPRAAPMRVCTGIRVLGVGTGLSAGTQHPILSN
jgi:hypothetical protein